MICQELALLSKNPLYCGQCQSAVFCKECIKNWMRSNNSCPNCRCIRPEMKSL
jgi:hypothetical protein